MRANTKCWRCAGGYRLLARVGSVGLFECRGCGNRLTQVPDGGLVGGAL